jgi:hypothetical protein
MFNKLCGKDAAKNIILATTKWDQVQQDVGDQREGQLAGTFWQDLIRIGSRTVRFSRTTQSAWAVVDSIVDEDPINDVLIQQELVDLLKILPETEAGNTLRYTLHEMLDTYKKAARQLQQDVKESNGEEGRQRLAEMEGRMRDTVAQIRQIQIPISRRIMKIMHLL